MANTNFANTSLVDRWVVERDIEEHIASVKKITTQITPGLYLAQGVDCPFEGEQIVQLGNPQFVYDFFATREQAEALIEHLSGDDDDGDQVEGQKQAPHLRVVH